MLKRLLLQICIFAMAFGAMALPHAAFAQVTGGAFPDLGYTPEDWITSTDGFHRGFALFKLIAGKHEDTNGDPDLSLFYLALAGAMVGAGIILFNPKMQKPATIGCWLLFLFILLIGPYSTSGEGSKNPLFWTARDKPTSAQEALSFPENSSNGTVQMTGFYPQMLIIHYMTKIHRAIHNTLFNCNSNGCSIRDFINESLINGRLSNAKELSMFGSHDYLLYESYIANRMGVTADLQTKAPYNADLYQALAAIYGEGPENPMLSPAEDIKLRKKIINIGSATTLFQLFYTQGFTAADNAFPPVINIEYQDVWATEMANNINAIKTEMFFISSDDLFETDDSDYSADGLTMDTDVLNMDTLNGFRDEGLTYLNQATVKTDNFNYTDRSDVKKVAKRLITEKATDFKKDGLSSLNHTSMLFGSTIDENSIRIMTKGNRSEFHKNFDEFNIASLSSDDSPILAALGYNPAILETPVSLILYRSGNLKGGRGATDQGLKGYKDGYADGKRDFGPLTAYTAKDLHQLRYYEALDIAIFKSGIKNDSNRTNLIAGRSRISSKLFYNSPAGSTRRAILTIYDTAYRDISTQTEKLEKAGLQPNAQLISRLARIKMAHEMQQVIQSKILSEGRGYFATIPQGLIDPSMEATANQAMVTGGIGGALGNAAVGNGLGQWLVESVIKTVAEFTGAASIIYVYAINILLDLALGAVLMFTPMIMLMGLLIPSYAPGILITVLGSVLVLKMVPITITMINAALSMLLMSTGSSSGGWLNNSIEGALILFAAGGLYTSAVGLSMFLLFKIGDSGNIQKIGELDGAAKKIGDAVEKGAAAVAISAGAIAMGGVGGALGAGFSNKLTGDDATFGGRLKAAAKGFVKEGSEPITKAAGNIPVVSDLMKQGNPISAFNDASARAPAYAKRNIAGIAFHHMEGGIAKEKAFNDEVSKFFAAGRTEDGLLLKNTTVGVNESADFMKTASQRTGTQRANKSGQLYDDRVKGMVPVGSLNDSIAPINHLQGNYQQQGFKSADDMGVNLRDALIQAQSLVQKTLVPDGFDANGNPKKRALKFTDGEFYLGNQADDGRVNAYRTISDEAWAELDTSELGKKLKAEIERLANGEYDKERGEWRVKIDTYTMREDDYNKHLQALQAGRAINDTPPEPKGGGGGPTTLPKGPAPTGGGNGPITGTSPATASTSGGNGGSTVKLSNESLGAMERAVETGLNRGGERLGEQMAKSLEKKFESLGRDGITSGGPMERVAKSLNDLKVTIEDKKKDN